MEFDDEFNSTTDNGTFYDIEYVNETEEEYIQRAIEYIAPTFWIWVSIFFYSLVFVIGLVGNALVCTAVYRNRSMRTVTNYFIMNLSVADFLVILTCLPPTLTWNVTSTWFFGNVACKVVLYLQTVSVAVSVLTLTFISIERWYAVCYPLKFKATTARARKAILSIWLLALLFDIPELIVYETEKYAEAPYETIYFTQCTASWPKNVDTSWTVLKMAALYIIPLVFMMVTYSRIICALWTSGSGNQYVLDIVGNTQVYNFSLASNMSTNGQLRSRKKTAKMLVCVVVVFALCNFPVHVISLLRLVMDLQNHDGNRACSFISQWLCYANSAINPVIYNFMSGKFRKEFKRFFDCCKKRKSFRRYELASTNKLSWMSKSTTTSRTSRGRRDGSQMKRTDTVSEKLFE